MGSSVAHAGGAVKTSIRRDPGSPPSLLAVIHTKTNVVVVWLVIVVVVFAQKVVVVFTRKAVPDCAQYLVTPVPVQPTRTPSVRIFSFRGISR